MSRSTITRTYADRSADRQQNASTTSHNRHCHSINHSFSHTHRYNSETDTMGYANILHGTSHTTSTLGGLSRRLPARSMADKLIRKAKISHGILNHSTVKSQYMLRKHTNGSLYQANNKKYGKSNRRDNQGNKSSLRSLTHEEKVSRGWKFHAGNSGAPSNHDQDRATMRDQVTHNRNAAPRSRTSRRVQVVQRGYTNRGQSTLKNKAAVKRHPTYNNPTAQSGETAHGSHSGSKGKVVHNQEAGHYHGGSNHGNKKIPKDYARTCDAHRKQSTSFLERTRHNYKEMRLKRGKKNEINFRKCSNSQKLKDSVFQYKTHTPDDVNVSKKLTESKDFRKCHTTPQLDTTYRKHNSFDTSGDQKLSSYRDHPLSNDANQELPTNLDSYTPQNFSNPQKGMDQKITCTTDIQAKNYYLNHETNVSCYGDILVDNQKPGSNPDNDQLAHQYQPVDDNPSHSAQVQLEDYNMQVPSTLTIFTSLTTSAPINYPCFCGFVYM